MVSDVWMPPLAPFDKCFKHIDSFSPAPRLIKITMTDSKMKVGGYLGNQLDFILGQMLAEIPDNTDDGRRDAAQPGHDYSVKQIDALLDRNGNQRHQGAGERGDQASG